MRLLSLAFAGYAIWDTWSASSSFEALSFLLCYFTSCGYQGRLLLTLDWQQLIPTKQYLHLRTMDLPCLKGLNLMFGYIFVTSCFKVIFHNLTILLLFSLFSHAIMRYLFSKYKAPDHWYPSDPQRRAKVDEALDWFNGNLRCGCFFNSVSVIEIAITIMYCSS